MASVQTRQLGKYVILDQLAVGGMAELFRAMITNVQGFEKLLAIKKILPHLASEEELVTAFIEEAQLAALLHHPNIVQIHDFDNLEQTHYIAMEYLLGKDCRSINSRAQEKNIHLDRQNALFIVSRVCAGLDYAHKLKNFRGKALNIVHRDVSPQNILVTYEGEVKIVDFGVARAVSQNTHIRKGMIKAKAAYMSPEQAMDKVIDHRSDIFSCGIILYELITGKRMFSGDTMHILAKIKEADFVKPEELQTDLPEKLLQVIDRALQKEPDRRYQSCGEMLSDLEECMQPGTRPSAQSLSQYMKKLYAEEIAEEEEYLQKIRQTGLTQVKKEPSTAQIPGAIVASYFSADNRRKLRQALKGLTKAVKTKKTLAAALTAGFLASIIVLVLLRQPGIESTASEIAEKPAAKETLHAEVSAETPGTELYQKAMDALVGRRFSEAIRLFEELLALGPAMKEKIASPYAEALVGLANSLSESEPQQATDLFKKAIQVDPGSEQAHFQLGMVLMKQENYAAAIESYQNVIGINPQFPDTFFNLGFIYALAKDYARAEEMYARVVELNPDYLDEALFNLALVQTKLNKKDKSIANLKKAVKINPKNDLAQNYLTKLTGVSN